MYIDLYIDVYSWYSHVLLRCIYVLYMKESNVHAARMTLAIRYNTYTLTLNLCHICTCAQVPRILKPIAECLQRLPGLVSDPPFHEYVYAFYIILYMCTVCIPYSTYMYSVHIILSYTIFYVCVCAISMPVYYIYNMYVMCIQVCISGVGQHIQPPHADPERLLQARL